MSLEEFVFQACSFNHSDISPLFGARRRPFGPVPSGGSLKLTALRSRVAARSAPFATLPLKTGTPPESFRDELTATV